MAENKPITLKNILAAPGLILFGVLFMMAALLDTPLGYSLAVLGALEILVGLWCWYTGITRFVIENGDYNRAYWLDGILCLILFPYSVYWCYSIAKEFEEMFAAKGVRKDLKIPAVIFSFILWIGGLVYLTCVTASYIKTESTGEPLFTNNVSMNETIKTNSENDTINVLRDYNALLSQGIITQEEFDAKKKELLGL